MNFNLVSDLNWFCINLIVLIWRGMWMWLCVLNLCCSKWCISIDFVLIFLCLSESVTFSHLIIYFIFQPKCSWCFSCQCHSRQTTGQIPRNKHGQNIILSYQTGQYMAGRSDQAECQRLNGFWVSVEDVWSYAMLFWKDQWRECQE